MTDYEHEDISDEPTVQNDASAPVVATLPLEIAKAMKPIVCGSVMADNPALQQILCEPGPDLGRDRTARYVGTSGAVMLVVDTNLPAPTDAQVFDAAKRTDYDTGKAGPSDVAMVVSSKGHYKPEYFRARDYAYTFPEYKNVMPSSSTAVECIGFNVGYMDLMLKINKALRLPSMATWSVRFDGPLGPTTWECMHMDADGLVTRAQLIVMPVRLD